MSRLSQGLRFAEALTRRGALASAWHTRPFSTSAFLLARDLRTGCGCFASVVDVGANAGQFSLAMLREHPGVSILALEPLPDVAAALRANVARHPTVRVSECAAGAVGGSALMHRHVHTLSSSLLATTRAFETAFPESARQGPSRPVEVDVARLDDLVSPDELVGPTLLKLDVQGFEIEALKGAERLLSHCDWVLAEAAVERVYDGEPLFADLYDHLRSRGFAFDRPVDLLRGARGTVSQMDVLFRREAST